MDFIKLVWAQGALLLFNVVAMLLTSIVWIKVLNGFAMGFLLANILITFFRIKRTREVEEMISRCMEMAGKVSRMNRELQVPRDENIN